MKSMTILEKNRELKFLKVFKCRLDFCGGFI